MGDRAYCFSLHDKRAAAAGRICPGGNSAGWDELIRLGFWGRPRNCQQGNDAPQKEGLIPQSWHAGSVPRQANPALYLRRVQESENNQRVCRGSAGASARTSLKRDSTSETRKGFWKQ